MTTEPSDNSDTDARASTTPLDAPITVGTVLKTAGAHIRRDPVLIVPFTIAGLLVALVDWLRTWDPLPVAMPDSFGQTLSIQYSIFPMGTTRTVRHVDALIDLRLSYFVGAVALELLVLLAVGLAGWLTITRALATERRLDSLARYLGGLAVVAIPPRILGSPTLNVDSLLLGVLAFLVAALVLVRLFLLPGCLAAGCQVTTAFREGVRQSRGIRWPLFWLIVVFGLASWGLARIPIAGGFLSTTVVSSVHAVSLAVLLREG